MNPKKLNKSALLEACEKVANQTLWQTPHPQDISDIIDFEQRNMLAQKYFEKALQHVEFITGQERDPNLITRAVVYLAYSHAIPPMKDDLSWFNDMLEALIELACPNVLHFKETSQFLYDIEKGINETRKNIKTA